MDNENIGLLNKKVKVDIYQHLKLSLRNKEKNCNCDSPPTEKYYCIPCKISCCSKCSLLDHKNHLLVKKSDFELVQNNIERAFKNFEETFEKEDIIKTFEKKNEELNNNINQTYNSCLKMINDWKNKKLEEVKNMFDELNKNLKSMINK